MSRFEPSLLAADAQVRTAFLDALRDTGSVVAAARTTGVAPSTAHRQRRRDRAFAVAWDAAVGRASVAGLEAALIARARDGVERYRFHAGGGVDIWREYDSKLGLALLAALMPEVHGRAAATVTAPPRPVMTRAQFIAAIRAQPRLDPPLPGGEDDDLVGDSAA